MSADSVLESYLGQQPFVTRQWLADLLDERMRDQACRHVLITADAGMGKSSFLAWLTTRYPLVPYYFIRLDSITPSGSADATHLLMSLGRQLAAACPEAMEQQPLRITVDQRTGPVGITGSVVGFQTDRLIANPFRRTDIEITQRTGRVWGEEVAVRAEETVDSEWLLDVPTLQRLALLDPAAEVARCRPDARILVLIDGLDELRNQPVSPRWTIADWLVNCPDLPANVRVVVTSRPDGALLRSYRLRQRSRLREITIAGEQVAGDLSDYADRLCQDDRLREALAERGVDLGASARTAVTRARGNFLYLVSWARSIRYAVSTGQWDEVRRLIDGAALPDSVAELFELFVVMLRATTADSWESTHRPVLGALTVARAPLTSRQIALLAGLPGRAAELALLDMPHFLRCTAGRYEMFHTALGDYLQSEEARAAVPECWVDPAVTNKDTAARLIEAHAGNWAGCQDDYALVNVVPHLVAAMPEDPRWCAGALADLLADNGFLARKAAVAGVLRTVADFAEAHNAAPDAGIPGTLARHVVRGDTVDVDSLLAALGYREEFGEFYDRLLELLTDLDFVTEHATDEANSIWADYAEIKVHRLRWSGRVGEATELLGKIPSARAAQSRTHYERGYLHFVHGRVDEALASLTESVDAALQAGDEVNAWITRLVRDQMTFYAGRVDAETYAAVLDEADAFFTALPSHPHRDRWLMNVHNLKLTLAYLTGDAAAAAHEWEVLRDNDWVARERPEFFPLWEARAAITAGNWARAAVLYEQILGPSALDDPPPVTEGIAWKLLDYGRALDGIGRRSDAVRAWNQVLRCADTTAAWPWKPQAQALLDS